MFYSVREKNFDDRGARRQADREFSKRAELETEMAKQREAYVKQFGTVHMSICTEWPVDPRGRLKMPSPTKLDRPQLE